MVIPVAIATALACQYSHSCLLNSSDLSLLKDHRWLVDFSTIVVARDSSDDGSANCFTTISRKHGCISKTHLLAYGRNSQYTSPRFKNEIINACNDLMLE